MTVTFIGPSGGSITSGGVVAVEYSGLDTQYPLDSVSAGYSTSGNPTSLMDSGTVAPANANLLVFGGGTSDNTGGVSAGSGFSGIQPHNGSTGSSIVEANTAAISGNNVLQRATASSTPALTNANWVMQMAVFRDASWNVAGGWSPPRFSQVLDATQFPGSDIGAQVTAAQAALPVTGGRIRIPPNPAGGCWNFSTPISFSTSGQVIALEGDPGGATCLNFISNASSQTAVTIDYGTAHQTGGGLRDIAIYGPCSESKNVPSCSGLGSTSIGVALGPTNGVDQESLMNVQIGQLGGGFDTNLLVHTTFGLTRSTLRYPAGTTGFSMMCWLNTTPSLADAFAATTSGYWPARTAPSYRSQTCRWTTTF